jgi:hypothetical protein
MSDLLVPMPPFFMVKVVDSPTELPKCIVHESNSELEVTTQTGKLDAPVWQVGVSRFVEIGGSQGHC